MCKQLQYLSRLHMQFLQGFLFVQYTKNIPGSHTVLLTENGQVTGVQTQLGAIYHAKAAIIATGTFLDSTIVIGESVLPDIVSCPDADEETVAACLVVWVNGAVKTEVDAVSRVGAFVAAC